MQPSETTTITLSARLWHNNLSFFLEKQLFFCSLYFFFPMLVRTATLQYLAVAIRNKDFYGIWQVLQHCHNHFSSEDSKEKLLS